jgi:SAM-dependent methyltransferase
MTNASAERVNREKASYDEGSVYEESVKFQGRFLHVFHCNNTRRGEALFSDTVRSAAKGADVLDYGCLHGAAFPEFFAAGAASVTGIDISEKGIAEAKATYGDKATCLVMDAHKLDFPDASFDFVVGRSILHHLDFPVAIREISRVLRPGGTALFEEPLRGNPAAKLLRKLTPKARTADELPLNRSQILWADAQFSYAEHHFVNLLSVPAGMISSLFLKSADNWLLNAVDVVDMAVSHSPMKYWMRRVILIWKK